MNNYGTSNSQLITLDQQLSTISKKILNLIELIANYEAN